MNVTDVIRLYGEPIRFNHEQTTDTLTYESFILSTKTESVAGKQQSTLTFFSTDTSTFCFLSDTFPEGVKVGTRLADLQNFNFVKTKTGRGDPANAIQYIPSGDKTYPFLKKKANYILFGNNTQYYILAIEDGKVAEWAMATRPSKP